MTKSLIMRIPCFKKALLFFVFMGMASFAYAQEKPTFESESGKDSLRARHYKEYVKPKKGIVVPDALTEEFVVPVFNKCKKATNRDERIKCFDRVFHDNVRNKLYLPSDGVAGTQVTLEVKFIFQKDGEIGQIEFLYSDDPTGSLEKAVVKMLHRLPKFIPGTKAGKPCDYPFSFPIKVTY